MSLPALAPSASPSSAPVEAAVFALCRDLDAAALRQLASYLLGVAAERETRATSPLASGAPVAAAAGVPASATRATVLFASQTGNGRRIAEKLHQQLAAQGLAARLVNVADYPVRELADERVLFFVTSTHGDGEPPDDARAFVEYVTSRKAPKLERLRFAVLALGDSSYPKFCETGRQFDERLAALGAVRLLPRVDCDVDFDVPAASWQGEALRLAREHLQAPHLAIVVTPPAAQARQATREAPVESELLATGRLTARDAERAVVHLEIAAPAEHLAYEPGDALGVWHENPELVVEALAEAVGADPDEVVAHEGTQRSLKDWLRSHRETTRLTRPFLVAHAARSAATELSDLLQPGREDGLRELLRRYQPIDVLERWPAAWNAAELVAALRPLTPRLYSIASSRAEVGDEVHVTVAHVDYLQGSQRRVGAASTYLASEPPAADRRLRVFVESNPRFRLPADGDRDIVMIGPGTGVAPFRGFLQQRVASGARGRNWLFFGGRHLFSDFLYQTEWLKARRDGTLHRLDVAFSRDQAEKIYVQHRLLERGAELYAWLEGGGHLYVCGDAERMAPDVHAALRAIVERHGGKDADAAEQYLQNLVRERRYARDVY